MTPAGKAALLAAIAGGKGFLGVHSATDTFHTAGRNDHVPERFLNDGDAADDYIKIGGEFIRHGKQQVSLLTVADKKFPGMSEVPAGYGLYEEWYSLKDFVRPISTCCWWRKPRAWWATNTKASGLPLDLGPHVRQRPRILHQHGPSRRCLDQPCVPIRVRGRAQLGFGPGRTLDVTPNLATAAPGANQLPVLSPPARARGEQLPARACLDGLDCHACAMNEVQLHIENVRQARAKITAALGSPAEDRHHPMARPGRAGLPMGSARDPGLQGPPGFPVRDSRGPCRPADHRQAERRAGDRAERPQAFL